MTNMIPQAPEDNQQLWANLESYCCKLAQESNELYIIKGNYETRGTGILESKNTIANGKITVPVRIWKVVVILPQCDEDAVRVTSSTRVIAVDSPNNIISISWSIYRTSVDVFENATCNNHLSSVSIGIQGKIESIVDKGHRN